MRINKIPDTARSIINNINGKYINNNIAPHVEFGPISFTIQKMPYPAGARRTSPKTKIRIDQQTLSTDQFSGIRRVSGILLISAAFSCGTSESLSE
jgi:hypothetical protein